MLALTMTTTQGKLFCVFETLAEFTFALILIRNILSLATLRAVLKASITDGCHKHCGFSRMNASRTAATTTTTARASVQVVRRGLGQRLRRGEQRVGELRRVRQRALGASRPPSVGHEPTADGDGHGHQGQERRDNQRDDEADLGYTHLFVACVKKERKARVKTARLITAMTNIRILKGAWRLFAQEKPSKSPFLHFAPSP